MIYPSRPQNRGVSIKHRIFLDCVRFPCQQVIKGCYTPPCPDRKWLLLFGTICFWKRKEKFIFHIIYLRGIRRCKRLAGLRRGIKVNAFPLPQPVAALYPAESCVDVIQSVPGSFQAVGDVLKGGFHLVIKIYERVIASMIQRFIPFTCMSQMPRTAVWI